MKKILLLICLIITTSLASFAIEAVELEKESINLDYFSDIYYGKVDKEKTVSPILKLFSEKGLEFEDSFLTSIKASFLYDGNLNFTNLAHSSSHFKHSFTAIEPTMILKFNEGKTKFSTTFNLLRDIEGHSNGFTEKISEIYVSHQLNKNQTILVGQGGRLKNTYDSGQGRMAQEMVLKSQLGRTFGDVRSMGIRNMANYKYLEYDIGLFDSTRYMKDFGNGIDFTGHLILKPFSDFNEKVSDFKLGGGYNIGQNNISYNNYSLFAGYDYKKFHIHAEYADADGYNGLKESRNKADGFYTLVSYDLHPKLTLLTRYDYFIANKNISSSYCQEYSIGFTYYLFKNMKLMLNYVNRNYSDKADSNMILFATRFII